MLPIKLLVKEHRLIERLIALMQKEGVRIKEEKLTDIDFIDNCIDFIETYADGCHQGKEEDIFFKELVNKKLIPEHIRILKELTEDHKYARRITSKLFDARNKNFSSTDEAAKQLFAFEIYEYLKYLIDFYPKHLKKEDKEFFLPCMDYFKEKEKKEMLDKFWEFDRRLIHEKYKKILKQYE
ncbi:MAG: hemerythrin domain-containing protein [Candidatus Humimicrobiaceae bacterium]